MNTPGTTPPGGGFEDDFPAADVEPVLRLMIFKVSAQILQQLGQHNAPGIVLSGQDFFVGVVRLLINNADQPTPDALLQAAAKIRESRLRKKMVQAVVASVEKIRFTMTKIPFDKMPEPWARLVEHLEYEAIND